jgi:hypothetical protein
MVGDGMTPDRAIETGTVDGAAVVSERGIAKTAESVEMGIRSEDGTTVEREEELGRRDTTAALPRRTRSDERFPQNPVIETLAITRARDEMSQCAPPLRP